VYTKNAALHRPSTPGYPQLSKKFNRKVKSEGEA